MDAGLLSLKWNNHLTAFCHVLSTIRRKESFSDATLACEGKFYPVHKLVLSTCSEYFEEIFNRTQCKQPVIVLKDIRFSELEALLNYMYIGEVNVLQNDLAGLIKAAECLKIKGLAVPDEAPSPPRSANRDAKRSSGTRESPQRSKRARQDDDSHRDASREGREHARLNASQNSSDTSLVAISGHNSSSSRSQRDANNRQGESRVNEAPSISSPSQPLEIIDPDESAVKTEMLVEPKEEEDSNDDILNSDNSLSYDPLNPGMQGEISEEGGQGFDPQILSSQPHTMEELVAQSMPGTSGMQGDSMGGWGGGQGASFALDAQGSGQSQQQPLLLEHLDSCDDGVIGSGGGIIGGPRKHYVCSQCLKSFLFPSHLERHIRTHTGEKTFACPYCPHKAARKDHLDVHLRTHSGDKPYSCPHCPFRSSFRSSLDGHLRTQHNLSE